MAELTLCVEAAVRELDPNGERDTRPTWWSDKWARLDNFDRLRKAHDELLTLDEGAKEIALDMRSILTLAVVGSTDRPNGLTPPRAHQALVKIAGLKEAHLNTMALAERRLRSQMTKPCHERLRAAMRAMTAAEVATARERDRLGRLLSMAELAAS